MFSIAVLLLFMVRMAVNTWHNGATLLYNGMPGSAKSERAGKHGKINTEAPITKTIDDEVRESKNHKKHQQQQQLRWKHEKPKCKKTKHSNAFNYKQRNEKFVRRHSSFPKVFLFVSSCFFFIFIVVTSYILLRHTFKWLRSSIPKTMPDIVNSCVLAEA